MMKHSLFVTFVLNILLCLPVAQAQDSLSFTIHHLYQSVRALGMGDAFTTTLQDEGSFLYNPGTLAFNEHELITLGIVLAGSPDSVQFIKDINEIQTSSMPDTDKLTELINLFQSQYGKSYSVRLKPFEMLWNHEDWAFAFIPLDLSVEGTLHQQIGPAVNTTIYGDTSVQVAKAWKLDELGMGVTGKFVNRLFFNQLVSATELSVNDDYLSREDISEGYTLDFDFGLLWNKESWPIFSRFSFVMRNVLDIGFSNSLDLLEGRPLYKPEPLHRLVDLGVGGDFAPIGEIEGHWSFELRDLGHPNMNWKKATHFGAELRYPLFFRSLLSLRGGVSQLNWTAGASLRWPHFMLDLASYANDVGTLDIDEDSRLYIVRFAWQF